MYVFGQTPPSMEGASPGGASANWHQRSEHPEEASESLYTDLAHLQVWLSARSDESENMRHNASTSLRPGRNAHKRILACEAAPVPALRALTS
jgi:hypothetical protein